VFELLHHCYLLAKPLYHLSETTTGGPPGIARHTYTFGPLYLGIVSRHPKNLESHHLAAVPTLPNFGHLGDVMRTVPLLHDAFKFVWCRDCAMVTTQPPKLDSSFALRN